jgi:trk system potassium uptake protein TrkA
MKHIIIGLGNFGGSLALKLTGQGHDVIGVDRNMQKVDFYKDRITHAICLDSTDIPAAAAGLPLREADTVIIAIGENEGANIMATAVMKQLNAKRIIARAVSPLHETVLEAMGITEIVHPEEETAERLAKKLNLRGVIDSFNLSDKYNVIEAKVPAEYIGQTVRNAKFREEFKVALLTIIRGVERKNVLGIARKVNEVMGVVSPELVLEKDDILVLFGEIKDIQRILTND